MVLGNLAAIAGNYLAVGVRFFVLAYAVRDGAEPEDLRAGLPMPRRVVRLTVPLAEIKERHRHDPTAGRQGDLREAASCIASLGTGFEDATKSWRASSPGPPRRRHPGVLTNGQVASPRPAKRLRVAATSSRDTMAGMLIPCRTIFPLSCDGPYT